MQAINDETKHVIWICCQCHTAERVPVKGYLCLKCLHVECSACESVQQQLQILTQEPDFQAVRDAPPPELAITPPQFDDSWLEMFHGGPDSPILCPDTFVDTSGFSEMVDKLDRTHLGEKQADAQSFQLRKHGQVYELTSATDGPTHHEDQLYFHVKDLTKDKADDERVMRNRVEMQKRLGFKPEKLIKAGALGKLNVKPNNLTGPVHSLLEQRNFVNCSAEVYEFLLPGLRLATMFLTRPVAMEYWILLLLCDRELIQHNDPPCVRPRIQPHLKFNEENANKASRWLQELGEEHNILSIRFVENLEFKATATTEAISCFGMASLSEQDTDEEIRLRRHSQNVRHRWYRHCDLGLHGDFYAAALKFVNTKYSEPSQLLRYYLFFAINLCHELGHATNYMHRFVDRAKEGFLYEPLFPGISQTENGIVWERLIFGGHVTPINGDISCLHGLSISKWPTTLDSPGGTSKVPVFFTVSMDYVERIQQQENWDSKNDIRLPRVRDWLQVNITGSHSSARLNATTTMEPGEDYRVDMQVQNEDEAMFRAIGKAGFAPESDCVFDADLDTSEILSTRRFSYDKHGHSTPPHWTSTARLQARLERRHRQGKKRTIPPEEQEKYQRALERLQRDEESALDNLPFTDSPLAREAELEASRLEMQRQMQRQIIRAPTQESRKQVERRAELELRQRCDGAGLEFLREERGRPKRRRSLTDLGLEAEERGRKRWRGGRSRSRSRSPGRR